MAAISEKPVDSAPVRRGWWRRNWKRFFGGLLLLAMLVAAGAWYHLFGQMLMNDQFKKAWAEVKQNKQVIAELGEPISGGWTPHGMIDNESTFPQVSMNFTISGPKGTAEVAALARSIKGSWGFPTFDVTTHPLDSAAAGKQLSLKKEINAGTPDDTPTFNSKEASKNTVTTKEATPDQDVKIDLDIPPAGK